MTSKESKEKKKKAHNGGSSMTSAKPTHSTPHTPDQKQRKPTMGSASLKTTVATTSSFTSYFTSYTVGRSSSKHKGDSSRHHRSSGSHHGSSSHYSEGNGRDEHMPSSARNGDSKIDPFQLSTNNEMGQPKETNYSDKAIQCNLLTDDLNSGDQTDVPDLCVLGL